jgi:hypothetical protein
VQDTDTMLEGSGSSAAARQRAAKRMARLRTSPTGPHTAEHAHTVTAHTPGRTTDNVLSTAFKACTNTYSSRLRLNKLLCPQDGPNSFQTNSTTKGRPEREME